MREWRCFAECERGVSSGTGAGSLGAVEPGNSWAGSPGKIGLGTYWVTRAVVSGPVGKQTGYVSSISDLDVLIRDFAMPPLRKWLSDPDHSARVLAQCVLHAQQAVAKHCPPPTTLDTLELQLCPQVRFAVESGDPTMVQFTQAFEFAASHRLYCSEWSESENRRVFGKCANANGHGHNYVVEVTVAGRPEEKTGSVTDLAFMQSVVRERVIEPFDHKFLNLDCAEFASINPSVENIAMVIWERLSGAFEKCRLTRIRVWETAKTYAEYEGQDAPTHLGSGR